MLVDFWDNNCGKILIFAGLALFAGLLWIINEAEKAEISAFRRRCIASGETAAKCEILVEVKRSADSAQISAAMAIGFAAGSSGRR